MQLRDAKAYADDVFGHYRRIHLYGHQWNSASFLTQNHTFAELVREMKLMQEYQDDLTKFRNQKAMGVVCLEAHELRSDLLQIPETALAMMEQALLTVLQKACVQAMLRLNTVLGQLKDRPSDMIAQETFKTNYSSILDEQDDLDDQISEVYSMHQQLKRQAVKMSLEDQVLLDELSAKHRQFNQTLNEAMSFIGKMGTTHVVTIHARPYAGGDDCLDVTCSILSGKTAEFQVSLERTVAEFRLELLHQFGLDSSSGMRLVLPNGKSLSDASDMTPIAELLAGMAPARLQHDPFVDYEAA